jgi:hypothetical protein
MQSRIKPEAPPDNEQLVPVSGFSVAFFDDVRVHLEKGDHFLTGRNLFSLQNPSSCLLHHPVEGLNRLPELLCQPSGSDGLQDIGTAEPIKNPDGFYRIPFNPQSDLKKIPLTTLANRLLLGVQNLHHALLHHPAVIGKPIEGSGAQRREYPFKQHFQHLNVSEWTLTTIRMLNMLNCYFEG